MFVPIDEQLLQKIKADPFHDLSMFPPGTKVRAYKKGHTDVHEIITPEWTYLSITAKNGFFNQQKSELKGDEKAYEKWRSQNGGNK